MKTYILKSISIISLFSLFAFAGDAVKEAEFKVFGNCGQCKTRIEKAMKISEVKFAKWDKTSKMLKVAYLSEKISLDSLQQRIASVGHDTEKLKAADSTYANLPGCCLYRDGNKTH
jgi:mercuric ion binding protein